MRLTAAAKPKSDRSHVAKLGVKSSLQYSGYSERRGFDRVCFAHAHGNLLRFRLRIEDRPAAIGDVIDLSRLGIGLRVTAAVEPGSTATLSLRLGNSTLAVSGVVRWCEPVAGGGSARSDNAYHLGIAFDPSETKNNILFFVTLNRFCESVR